MKHAVRHSHVVGTPGAGPRRRSQAASPMPAKHGGAQESAK